ncbi:MAG: 4Fe-4S binding protein [Bacteroidales bacterium]|jgi:NAD-dependent dihydropyrimidine dehydrogenase PreA subunit|nr:4Fe-4S binding protein [Bacteroidales bacterium]
MKRKIINIDEEKCNGCGLCIPNCEEGALKIIDGKARLISDLFCDGLGACLGHCPEGAIEIIEREAESFVIPMNVPSEFGQWPVQLHLLNPQAPCFKNADVVLAADCTAFTMGNFHSRYLKGKSLAIACPKLDSNKESYVQKLTAMITDTRINSLNVVMMEVPCCGGLLYMAQAARANAARDIPIKSSIISIHGEVLKEEQV